MERENLKLKEFFYYDLGVEHRPHNHWVYNLVNDVSVKVSPQLSDGVLAICKLNDVLEKADFAAASK